MGGLEGRKSAIVMMGCVVGCSLKSEKRGQKKKKTAVKTDRGTKGSRNHTNHAKVRFLRLS